MQHFVSAVLRQERVLVLVVEIDVAIVESFLIDRGVPVEIRLTARREGIAAVIERHDVLGNGLTGIPAIVVVDVVELIKIEHGRRQLHTNRAITRFPAGPQVVGGVAAGKQETVVRNLDIKGIGQVERRTGAKTDLEFGLGVVFGGRIRRITGRQVVLRQFQRVQRAQGHLAKRVTFIVDLQIRPVHADRADIDQVAGTIIKQHTAALVVRQGQQVDLRIELTVAGVHKTHRDRVQRLVIGAADTAVRGVDLEDRDFVAQRVDPRRVVQRRNRRRLDHEINVAGLDPLELAGQRRRCRNALGYAVGIVERQA